MRLLGLLLIVGGVFLCLTFFFAPWGFGAIAAGALLLIAAGKQPQRTTEGKKGELVLAVICALVVIVAIVLAGVGITSKPSAPAAVTPARQVQQVSAPPAKRPHAKASPRP